MVAARSLIAFACTLAFAGSAFALKGHDESNNCEIDLRGNHQLDGLDKSLKEGTRITVYDGCEKKTVTLEVREVNRWEKLDGVSYTIDTLDRSRMDGLRTRRFEMRAK